MKSRTLAAIAAFATALSGLAIATPATAGVAQPPQLSLYSSSINVHTSNGKQWKFSLSTYHANPSNDQLSLNLVRTVSAGTESHYWYVPVPSSVLSFNKTTQRGTLKTPGSTAPLTTVNLGFKATSHRNASCRSGSRTDYAGNLTGRATLITHLKGGGTVGGRTLTFRSGTTHLIVDNNCSVGFPLTIRCSNSVFFRDIAPKNHSMYGFSSGRSRSISVTHNVAVAHPAGTARFDGASAHGSSAPAFNKAAKTLKVFGSTFGLVTGSGRIVSKSLSHGTGTCKLNGKKHTQSEYLGFSSKFTNTSGHPIVGHMNLGGRITLANGGSAYFDVESWH